MIESRRNGEREVESEEGKERPDVIDLLDEDDRESVVIIDSLDENGEPKSWAMLIEEHEQLQVRKESRPPKTPWIESSLFLTSDSEEAGAHLPPSGSGRTEEAAVPRPTVRVQVPVDSISPHIFAGLGVEWLSREVPLDCIIDVAMANEAEYLEMLRAPAVRWATATAAQEEQSEGARRGEIESRSRGGEIESRRREGEIESRRREGEVENRRREKNRARPMISSEERVSRETQEDLLVYGAQESERDREEEA